MSKLTYFGKRTQSNRNGSKEKMYNLPDRLLCYIGQCQSDKRDYPAIKLQKPRLP